jgi:rhamnosyltransferase
MRFAVVVPTLNAAAVWPQFAPPLLASAAPEQVLIIDSSSSDQTADLARKAGFRVHVIQRKDFNHGGTRQLAVNLLPDVDLLVFLTQDAILATENALTLLLNAFVDPKVGAAFGRQLPRRSARPIEAHARLFNYPAQSNIRTLASREQMGHKAIFISNSFAAYRRSALTSVGGFPDHILLGEDTVTAAKLLLSDWKIAYVADAKVYHSHSYSWRQDFKRCFDIGVLHAREPWLLREFGQTGDEGRRFVRSELSYLLAHCPWLCPSALLRTAFKLIGYSLGKREKHLNLSWKRKFSMHHRFWHHPEGSPTRDTETPIS